MDLDLSVERNETTATLSLAGEVDDLAVPRFRRTARALLAAGATDLVIDLSRVLFMDSVGLNVLIELVHATNKVQGSVTVAHPSDQVRRILAITALDTVLTVRP